MLVEASAHREVCRVNERREERRQANPDLVPHAHGVVVRRASEQNSVDDWSVVILSDISVRLI